MSTRQTIQAGGSLYCIRALLGIWLLLTALRGGAAEGSDEEKGRIILTKGIVEFSPAGSTNWYAATTEHVLHSGDQLRTGERSQARLQFRDANEVAIPELTIIRIQTRPERLVLRLLRGILSFFHRGQPGDVEIEGGGLNAIIRGTEFAFAVDERGTAELTLFDGLVEIPLPAGPPFQLNSGEVATAQPGAPPKKTAVLRSGDLSAIQWALYYPAILDLDEIRGPGLDPETLGECLALYRSGRLSQALAHYPPGRVPTLSEEKLFLAALLLSSGNVAEAEKWLGTIDGNDRLARLARAQEHLIAAVQRSPCAEVMNAQHLENALAGELLAWSYCLQSQAKLEAALALAVRATEHAPRFGYSWARRAELEFSFGEIGKAAQSVQRALELTPDNAEALALKGFLEASKNNIQAAKQWFEQALAVDAALGNAWLGRGLCRIRQGDLAGGLADLEVAAAAEPQRAILRSYLAKGFLDDWRVPQAKHELDLAEKLDPHDPTLWLYRSLLDRDHNQINDAVRDLSNALNLATNRAVFRSRLMLDQDRAVAAANLSLAFRDAGMLDVGVQSASRAAAVDYTNPSAHQFLADSYATAGRVDLRYETPRVSEYLLANLLAPIGGGILSASLSQQEYSKLFESDGLGMYSDTAYLSRGAWTQAGGIHGTFGNSSFLSEGFYQTDRGFTPNNDLEQQAFAVQLKEQVTAKDTFYTQVLYSDFNSGDLARHYDPNDPNELNRDLRVREWLDPILLAGWHRQWSPESHTLLLAGVLRDRQEIRDPTQRIFSLETDSLGSITSRGGFNIDQKYQDDTSIYTLELQQLWQGVHHTALGGIRYQHGQFDVRNDYGANDGYNPLVLAPSSIQASPSMDRVQVYGYEAWRILPQLQLFAGLSFDYLRYPLDFQYAPPFAGEQSKTSVSPKVGLVWEVAPRLFLRGAYTRSLGGVSFEQSFRLEPTQVAGFNQAFRSLIPESLAGVSAAPEFETLDLAFEAQLGNSTWISIGGERLTSDVHHHLGIYEGNPDLAMLPALAREDLSFEENSLHLTFDQLLGPYVALGAKYRLSWSKLDDRFADIPALFAPNAEDKALLHELRLSAFFNHPCGAFGNVETSWYAQANPGDSGMRDEDFWQVNMAGGYRFAHRHAELSVGVLNVTDRDFRLNPLSYYAPPERQRTFFARLRWAF